MIFDPQAPESGGADLCLSPDDSQSPSPDGVSLGSHNGAEMGLTVPIL